MSLITTMGASEEEQQDNSTIAVDTTDTMEGFVTIAVNESNKVAGKKGGDKYRQWYSGKADGVNWCATFVSWCADQSGILNTAIPKFQSCDAGVKWFKDKNQFDYTSHYGGGGLPARGKIIFFCKGNKNDSTHVGIVTKVEGNKVYTVEGNTSNTVRERSYDTNNPRILGYASPNYPSSANTGSSSQPLQGSLSEAFKFFAKFESGQNYGQGFSSGDGYHAMGYYQFDNRYDLQTFLSYCYGKDHAKYAMFAPYLNMNKKDLANNKGLDTAWKQAYKNDPNDFAAKQDEFEYNNYYVPVENNLRKKGIDISGKSDAVKGMACSLSNWAGSGTAPKIIADSGAKTTMDDRTFVSKVYDYLYSLDLNGYKKYGKTGAKYYNGWHNRWKNEKAQCLKYL